MKFVLILAPGILCYILCIIKSKYRLYITGAFFVYVILMNIYYNQRIVGYIMDFIRPVNQLMYQPQYAESKEFSDAFIELVINGKDVYTKDDAMSLEEAEDIGYNWLYAYYHANNPIKFLEHHGARVIKDKTLNEAKIDEAMISDFEDIGYANDMLRNVCMYHDDTTDVGNYFFHFYYFSDFLDGIHVYVNTDGLYDTNELVFLWQEREKGKEQEDIYLMTKEYYDRIIKSDK